MTRVSHVIQVGRSGISRRQLRLEYLRKRLEDRLAASHVGTEAELNAIVASMRAISNARGMRFFADHKKGDRIVAGEWSAMQSLRRFLGGGGMHEWVCDLLEYALVESGATEPFSMERAIEVLEGDSEPPADAEPKVALSLRVLDALTRESGVTDDERLALAQEVADLEARIREGR